MLALIKTDLLIVSVNSSQSRRQI